MDILIVGTEGQAQECRQKFGTLHAIRHVQHVDAAVIKLADVVFDFDTPQNPSQINCYKNATEATVFFDTSIVPLAQLLRQIKELKFHAFGFCGLQTFVNRELLEVAADNESDRVLLESMCAKLGTSFQIVADQAGMVTPRVICMIINEAYYTLEEGTATREDIDLAMKLGTNYPWGPFEWAERIGLKNIVGVLQAAERDTGDSRYALCGLLKKAAN